MRGFRFCLLAVFLGGGALALQAQKADLTGRVADDRASAAQPDAEPTAVATVAEALGPGGGCLPVGGLTPPGFTNPSRYRGNAFRITKTVTLTEIKMQLGLATDTTLYVAIHQKQPDNSWLRYPDPKGADLEIEAEAGPNGTASMVFHSTGSLVPPIALEGDHDYAIGFGWGAVNVQYDSDAVQYPQGTPDSFIFGQILGRITPTTTQYTGPPVPDSFSSLAVSGDGANSMELCVAGACCRGASCTEDSEVNCVGEGVEFTSPGTTCEDLANEDSCPLSRGACCISEQCLTLNQYRCESFGGDSYPGVPCDNQVCKPHGACCLPGGDCVDDQTLDSCNGQSGRFRGEGVLCADQPSCEFGACCLTEIICVIDSPSGCNNDGGVFKGRGEPCAQGLCIPKGACCNSTTGVCLDDVSKPDCDNLGRTFRGEGSVCASLSPACGRGACCGLGGTNSFLGCADAGGAGVTLSDCQALHGDFRGDDLNGQGLTCSTVSPHCPGNCCWDLGCNSGVTPELCESLPGTFLPYGESCAPNPCPVSGVDCCLGSGVCVSVASDATCNQLRGSLGCGDCGPPVPRGSCCDRIAFTCDDDVRRVDCPTEWAENVACAELPNPCEPHGACCDRGGLTCEDGKLEAECPTEWTSGESCDQLAIPCAPTGACCSDETCAILTQSDCVLQLGGGVYLGDDTTCGAKTCAPTGACCVALECSLTTELGCTGRYVGDATACGVDTCTPKGACCKSGDCTIETEVACTGDAGTYGGDDTACNAQSCETGACCDNLCACTDVTIGAECEAAGGLFHPGLNCAAFTCPLRIKTSNPANCAIDAGQPEAQSATAPRAPQGINRMTVTMTCPGAASAQFQVEGLPDATPITNPLFAVAGANVTVLFRQGTVPQIIPLQQYTCVRHIPSDTRTCIGFLPGDTDNSGTTDPDDVGALVDNLDAATLPPLQCDTNRSTKCTPLDILTNIDLQNGSDFTTFWGGAQMPIPCPSGGP